MSWSESKSYLQGQGQNCTHAQSSHMGHNSLLPHCIWVICHTKIIVVHDEGFVMTFTPRSYLQGHGHGTDIAKIHVWTITPHYYVWSGKYFTQLLSMTQGCYMTLTQGHIFKFKVTVHMKEILCVCNFSPVSRIWMILHTIVVQNPIVCHDLDPGLCLKVPDHGVHVVQIPVQVLTFQWWEGFGW